MLKTSLKPFPQEMTKYEFRPESKYQHFETLQYTAYSYLMNFALVDYIHIDKWHSAFYISQRIFNSSEHTES